MALPSNILDWLRARGLHDAIIAANGIGWNGNEIVIPILDVEGKFLFNKYRRDPFVQSDAPKYRYEFGSTAQLFGAHLVSATNNAIVSQGEREAMRLQSAGYVAVCSTGGAGTFKDEWLPMLAGHDLYVCYDNDEAGMKGGAKLLTKMNAKLVIVPERVNGTTVKDVTDYLKAGGSFPVLLEEAQAYPFLSEALPELRTIKQMHEVAKKFKYHLEMLQVKERNLKSAGRAHAHLDAVRALLLGALDNLDREVRKIRYLKEPTVTGDGRITEGDIERAKQVPMDTLYQGQLRRIGNKMTGLCPFHDEGTGSFTIYVDVNNWHCFGCNGGRDAIDFVMKKENLKFLEAVKKLIGK